MIPSFPWIAPPTPSTLAQSKERKGSNFAIWQPCYRYKNFHIGTNQEEEVVAGASCCLEKMRVRVFDVAGNLREETAYNGGTGAKLNTQEIW